MLYLILFISLPNLCFFAHDIRSGWRQEHVSSKQHRVERPVLLQPNDQPVEPESVPQHPEEQGRGGRGGRLHLRGRRLAGIQPS